MTRDLPDNLPEQPQDLEQPPEGEQPETDYLEEIRQDLKSADQQEQSAKKSGWLARLTGRLHPEKHNQEPDEPADAPPQPVSEEPEAEPEPGPPVSEPAEEAPKSLAFDIEVEEVTWTPPEGEEEEPIDDELFSSRLEAFSPAEIESDAGAEPSVHVSEGELPAEEAPSPPDPDHPTAPFVIDDPVVSEIDFNAPLPPLEDPSEPLEAESEPESDPLPAEEASSLLPFVLADEDTPAGPDVPAEPEEEPFTMGSTGSDEEPSDLPDPEAPFASEETPIEPAAEPEESPAKPGFLARIFPFRRAEKEPDRYTMDDAAVTGRLQQASTTAEEHPDMPEPGKEHAADEDRPPAPGGTRPFWNGISEGDQGEDDPPQTEEEFWEALARKERDQDSLFRSRRMNWAAFKEPQTPPAKHTTPFDDELDEDWPGEGPSVPGDPDSFALSSATAGADEEAIPIHTPFSVDEPAEDAEPESSDEPAEADYRQTILPGPDADETEVDVGELRSIALENYEDQPDDAGDSRNRVSRWLAAHRVALLLSALVICSLAAIVMIAWPMVMRHAAAQPAAATATPDPAALPYPVGLRLTGGWFFNLQKGQLTDGTWNPTSGEWLEGTELRRVIALPWNRQLDAVIGSLLPGDEMLLHMSNNDVQSYAVESVEQVTRSDRDLLSGNDPSLLIVLVDPESDLRWVVLSTPARSVDDTR